MGYPHNLGYRMPAEWTRHRRTYVSWPVQSSMCYPEDYAKVCRGYAEIIRVIAEFEPVTVLANPTDAGKIERFFREGFFAEGASDFLYIAHNDAWLRDNGPTFLLDDRGGLAGVDWQFNAWGGKYSPWDLDNRVAAQVLEAAGIQSFAAPLVLEGGSIHVDGEGTLLATEQCLLHPNRNPGWKREEIERVLRQFLNVRKVIWLKNGLAGDETDGHIDNVACFAAPGKIIIQVCDEAEDENYRSCQENLEILKSTVDARGRALELICIRQPPPRVDPETGKRLTLSYLNFYFVNGGIILPVFGGDAVDTDCHAVQTLAEIFPARRIRQVNGMAIIREGGNVHCITQQMPEGIL